MRIFVCILVLSFVVPTAWASVEESITAALAKSGLHLGYDRKSGQLIAVGTSSIEVESPKSDPLFASRRSALIKEAILDARVKIVGGLQMKVHASDAVATAGNGLSVMSALKLLAHGELSGCTEVCSVEEWNPEDKSFEIAVAVRWCEKSKSEALASIGGSPDDDDSAYREYVKGLGNILLVGCRRFTGKDGVRRMIAVGMSDVTGTEGLSRRSAMRAAEAQAAANLAFGLQCDIVSRSVARQYVSDDGDKQLTWESYVSDVAARCQLKVPAHEVYGTIVRDPISGRSVYVSCYGIVLSGHKCK